MKRVKNLGKRLVVSFEGRDYKFPENRIRRLDDNLYEHLKERYPSAFDFNPKPKKDKKGKEKLPKMVTSDKTRVYTKKVLSTDMHVTKRGMQQPTFGQVDLTPQSGTTDSDGVGWYGEGAVIEK